MISSTNDKAMRVLSHGVLLLIAVLALVPFVLLVIASFTQNSVALTEGYSFFPSAYSTAAYEYLAQEPPFAVICFKNWSLLTQWRLLTGLTPTQQNVFYRFADWTVA